MNSAPLPAAGESTAANGAIAGAAPADALPLDPAQLAAAGLPAAMPFLQFMDLNAVAAPAGEPVQETASTDAAQPDAPLDTDADVAEQAQAQGAGSDTLLAAMALPLMPSMMMALPAALPAALRFAAGVPDQGKRPAEAAPVAAGAGAGAALPPAVAAASAPAQADTAGAQLARASAAVQPAPVAAASQPAAASAQPREGAAAADSQAAPAAASTGFGVAAPTTPAAPRDGATLALAGPPTAWRQSLQQALGERLNVQLTKNAEQAVIRLEPPMLGRVEISIRHIAGSLEVNITATHSEVLRQLNTVSDNLRSDLAGRQYLDVSVNVSQAAVRTQAAAQAGGHFGAGADAQGRGRQQGQDQDERAPGAALLDAHQPNSAFSLNARA